MNKSINRHSPTSIACPVTDIMRTRRSWTEKKYLLSLNRRSFGIDVDFSEAESSACMNDMMYRELGRVFISGKCDHTVITRICEIKFLHMVHVPKFGILCCDGAENEQISITSSTYTQHNRSRPRIMTGQGDSTSQIKNRRPGS